MAKTADSRKKGAGRRAQAAPAKGDARARGDARAAKAKGDARAAKAPSRRDGNARGAARARVPARPPRAERRGLAKFLREVRVEMGKVTWPDRKDLAQSTLVVLVAVAIATAYTGVLDEIFVQIIDRIVALLT